MIRLIRAARHTCLFCIVLAFCFFLEIGIAQSQCSGNNITIAEFIYQLQDADLNRIGETGFDLVILDYSADGSDAGAYSAQQVADLKHSCGGEKIVLAYMSIGEAERYRFYWQNSWLPGFYPSWLKGPNPDWPGNYKVEYWHADWQNIIFSYLDRILIAGFDGVYLDIIDAYEYFADRGRTAAAREMVDFVAAISFYSKVRNPEFLLFVQNAAELAGQHPDYLTSVHGIGQEDLYYGYDADGAETPPEITAEIASCLDILKNQGKWVLTIDYPFADSEDVPHFDATTVHKIDSSYARSLARGYIPYCTVRNLNFLTINPGHEPTVTTAVFAHPQKEAACNILRNFPNPFNTTTTIEFNLSRPDRMSLCVYDLRGRIVVEMALGDKSAGRHRVSLEMEPFAAGTYLVRLQGDGFHHDCRMLLLR
ncbi:endo alpha-1,4 polygalactosaminidase [candidate division KSB1 bacterium]|nr:endo alpha-1,4 polygalactosaminidase [candidate division KSB1 bacterium]